MNKTSRSILAVLAGFFLIGLLGFITDTILQQLGVLPVTGTLRFKDEQSLMALIYHLLFAVAGGYVTARLAPDRPIAHAVALGMMGVLISIAGLFAIIQGDLAPAWYDWALIILSIPVTWLGGRLFARGEK